MAKLAALTALGLRPVLTAALERYRRTGDLGRSRPDLAPGDWEALSRLTGKKEGRTLDLAVLDAALRRSRHAVPLLDVLEELNGGPIRVRRQERDAFAASWAQVLAAVHDADWREVLQEGGGGASLLQKSLKHGLEIGPSVQTVAAALRVARAERLSFPLLAARLTGDAHALDVSSAALCVGLRGPAWLTGAAGHVLALPLREVLRLEGLHAPGNRVWVVENPSIFEALHAACPRTPLICTSGQPGAATVELLRRLPTSTTAFLSCDLDTGGLRIAAFLRRSVPLDWQPWRMDAAAYALACSRGTVPLSGSVSGLAALFPGLVPLLEESGRGAHQENLLPELLADLEQCPA